jgi:hypothetical protein
MNIYKVIFSHHAPKDSEQGIKVLILAENDEQVYNWIVSEPETSEGKLYNSWKDNEQFTWNEEKESFVDKYSNVVNEGWWDEDCKPENFKDRMLRLKGEMDDDSVDFSDSYYGITLLAWELLKENVNSINYTELIELGIVINLNK